MKRGVWSFVYNACRQAFGKLRRRKPQLWLVVRMLDSKREGRFYKTGPVLIEVPVQHVIAWEKMHAPCVIEESVGTRFYISFELR